jgi:DNA-binding response OmpR family regulator
MIPRGNQAEGTTNMPRVLLVEDEEPLRRILARNLTHRGYEVTEEGTAADAITALREEGRFDVLLLDVNLPDRTGWDVLRAMWGRKVPPVIVLTAVRPAQRRLDEFHPAAVLLKPFPIDALVRLVERVMSAQGKASTPSSELWA